MHGRRATPPRRGRPPRCARPTPRSCWVRSFSSVTCAPPQSSMIAPRENGSLLAPTSWFPSTATMPKGGRSRSSSSTTRREARGWLTMSPVRATRSAPHSHAEVDALPKRTQVERRRPGVQVAQVQDREAVELARAGRRTPTSSVRHSTHCDSKRPQAASADSGGRQGAERSASTPHARSRASSRRRPARLRRSARAACSRRSSSPEWPLPDAAIGLAPLGQVTRLRRPLQLLRGGGRESSACGDSLARVPQAPAPPRRPGRSSAANRACVGGVGRKRIGAGVALLARARPLTNSGRTPASQT